MVQYGPYVYQHCLRARLGEDCLCDLWTLASKPLQALQASVVGSLCPLSAATQSGIVEDVLQDLIITVRGLEIEAWLRLFF